VRIKVQIVKLIIIKSNAGKAFHEKIPNAWKEKFGILIQLLKDTIK